MALKVKALHSLYEDADLLQNCHGTLFQQFIISPPTLRRLQRAENQVSVNFVPKLRDIQDVPIDVPKTFRYSSDIKEL
jgi:hypothetical protein